MASKSNDLNITIKEGKTLIASLIDAINANTEVLKATKIEGAPETAKHDEEAEGKEERATQEKVNNEPVKKADSNPVQNQSPATPIPTAQPLQAAQPAPMKQVPTTQAVQPAPMRRASTAQVAQTPTGQRAPQTYSQTTTPAQSPYIPGATNTISRPVALVPPVNAAGPAQGIPTTATAPTASAAAPISAPATLEAIAKAGAELVNKGQMANVLNLLHSYGVETVNALKPAQYPLIAQQLRELGATCI